MKVYGDLIVKGGSADPEKFIASLDARLKNGWTRYAEREAEVKRAAFGPLYCFQCTVTPSRLAGELWIATQPGGDLHVSNILAKEFSSLTYRQYNAILTDFYSSCAKPAADAAGLSIELSNFDPQLEDFMSPATAKLLRNFSSLANRSILNPSDRRRWNEFLTSAYREGVRISPDLLQRWLIEEERWPDDEAINLAVEFEHARDLLEAFEAHHS